MVRRAAGHNGQALQRSRFLPGEGECLLPQGHGLYVHVGSEGLAQRSRLLVDLLEHKMGVAALLRSLHVPVHMDRLQRACTAIGIVHRHAVPAEDSDFLVLQQLHLTGVGDEGGNVAGDVLLALAKAHHQGAVLAGAVEHVRLTGADHSQRIAALQHVLRLAQGGQHVPVVKGLEEVRDDLRVRLGNKDAALGLQGRSEPVMILDDAVVYDGDVALHVRVGVGVQVGGLAVGGPAGMPDTDGTRQGCVLQLVLQIAKAALRLHQMDHALIHHRYACAVITAIFQAGQPLQQNGLRLLTADIAYNAAHRPLPPE